MDDRLQRAEIRGSIVAGQCLVIEEEVSLGPCKFEAPSTENELSWNAQPVYHRVRWLWSVLSRSPWIYEEKKNLVDALCGAWASDTTLSTIFAEVEQRRALTLPRAAHFDATS